MDEATRNDPNNSELWFVWGNINRKNRRYDKAYECYKKALDLSPIDPMYLSTYALSLRDHGHYPEADEYFSKSLLSKQTSMRHQIINRMGKAENLRRWAQVCARDRNYTEAIDKLLEAKTEISTALSIDPQDTKLAFQYKKVMLDIANQVAYREGISKARPIFEECISLISQSKGIVRFRDKEFAGKAYYYLAKHLVPSDESKTFLKIALKLTPKESNFFPIIVRFADRFKIKPLQPSTGIIESFNKTGKFGFIASDKGNKYFFHITAFPFRLSEETMANLINRRVVFDEDNTSQVSGKDRLRAVNINFETKDQ